MGAVVLTLEVLGFLRAAILAGFSMIDAIIQGIATIIAAVIAALIVIYQVDKSARHSREHLAEAERLKLNLAIYAEVMAASDAVCDQTIALQALLQRLQLELDNAARMKSSGQAQTSFRPLSISPTLDAAYASGIQIIRLVERWSILDVRLRVFQTAINVANYDLLTAYHRDLVPLLLSILPLDPPEGVQPYPWAPPSCAVREELDLAIERVRGAADTLNLYGMDFQGEMQGLLLTHLGKASVPRRTPLDPRVRVIRLDQADELTSGFEESAWAVDRRDAERRATAAIVARDAEVSNTRTL
ncbi:hypothetical protein [Brevundimonas vesicularis]|uniref:hypothetical protein n=1 Tax=Brevundimonas vesicularis TaxID=41276 RepID=UPI0028AFD319|nr:hypothetical protein [Brevundimonas vesicularis]